MTFKGRVSRSQSFNVLMLTQGQGSRFRRGFSRPVPRNPRPVVRGDQVNRLAKGITMLLRLWPNTDGQTLSVRSRTHPETKLIKNGAIAAWRTRRAWS